MDIQALTGSSIDTNSWAIKKVRGRLMIEPKPKEIVSPEEEAFANSVYLQVELKYIWVVDGANKECQIAMSWAPYYYPLDSTTPREYTEDKPEFSDTKFHKIFKDINSGFTIENIAADNSSIINLNSHTIGRVDFQYFKLIDTEWKSDPTFSFTYNTEEDGITYSISIPKWTILRPSKYDNNLVFNKDGLEDFINQIHEYPKTVFGIETLNSTETEKDNIGFGNVPVQIHGKWYGVPVQGLTGSGSGSGGNISSVDMIASYATYDASEVNNDPKIAISDKYVKKAGDTMTGSLIINATAQDGKEKLFWEVSNPASTDSPLRRVWSGYSSDAPTTWHLWDDSVGSAIIKSVRDGTTIENTFNGNASSATALLNECKFLVNLEKEQESAFNGTEDVKNIGVTGTLPIAHGGTGTTSRAGIMDALFPRQFTVDGTGTTHEKNNLPVSNINAIFVSTAAYPNEEEYDNSTTQGVGWVDIPTFQKKLGLTDTSDNSDDHQWVKRSGDTMTNQLTASKDCFNKSDGSSWILGRDNALVRRPESDGSYLPIWSCKSKDGEWTCGTYDKGADKTGRHNDLYWTYNTDESYEIKKNDANVQMIITDAGYLTAVRVYNAVFNDYAECRTTIDLTPGHVVVDQDDGSLACSSARLQPGAQVISDTYGHCMGETDTAKTPLAVAGRVLVYTYQPRENYHAGMAVCSAPNGTVDIMTREEIRDYPDCIIGIVSEIPQYETWGSNNVEVNGRIWIKVK